MRSHVFTDRGLAKHAGRFVWLSIDTEKEKNVGFVEKFPNENWPTFYVIEPATESVAFKWVGSANAAQLERLFDDAERALAETTGWGAEEALRRADRLFAAKKPAEAAMAFREALSEAPPDWPKRPRTVESLVFSLYAARDYEGCARAAAELAPSLPRGPSFANACSLGLFCATRADKELLAKLEPLGREALKLPGLLADDRSSLYETMVNVARERDGETARALAAEWLAFLEAERASSLGPEAKAAFDSHLVLAALESGQPARAVPSLEQSERDLPGDYNAPARLALLHQAMGQLDLALADCERALAKVYGPRRIRVLETKAKVLLQKGDKAAARAVYEQTLAFAKSLAAPHRSDRKIAALEAEIERLR